MQSHAVMLPCSPEQFSNFIGGLLGKPQTITQTLRGSFEITARDLVNIHHLIHQRISQQNGGELMQFTARIIFNDDSSVLINDLSDLESYNEIRPVISEQVHLSWVYIIKFNGREYPEKQTIDLSFLTKGGAISLDEIKFYPGWTKKRAGSVAFRIQHTARTWGSDLQALLDGHLRSLLTPEGSVQTFVREHDAKILLFVVFTLMLSMIVSIAVASNNLLDSLDKKLKVLTASKVSADAKLDGVLRFLFDDPWQTFGVYALAYLFSSIALTAIVAIWMETSLARAKPSFILLTPTSDRNKGELLNRYRNQWYSFFGSAIFSITTSIIASILFAKFW